MERVLLKLDKLGSLWSMLGSSCDSETLNLKLQHVIFELDRLLEYEELQRKFLAADIEDILASIEASCNILGVSIENLMCSGLCAGISMTDFMPLLHHQFNPNFTMYTALSTLDSRLTHEITQRRSRIKLWLSRISQLCIELGVENTFKSFEDYEDDLCWARVQSISCALRDLSQIQHRRKTSFEVSARSIQFYWRVLDIQPDLDNELEHALSKLFDQFPVHPDIEDKPTKGECKDFTYYEHIRADGGFVVTDRCITTLEHMCKELEVIYDERLALYKKYIKSISTIWNELNVPKNRRCTIRRFLGKSYLEQLETEFDNVKTMMRALAEEYIDKFKEKLEGLWDRALLTQKERSEFIARLHERADTMNEVHALVDEHMAYLQRLGPKAQIVDRLMRERKAHIQKMVDFEQSASDPERLFKSSFQLNEEERWRNTCFSTLLKLDDELYKAVREFEQVSGKPFMYNDVRYLDILNDEIANRDAFQTFFGFLNAEPKAKPKLQKTRSKPQPSPSNSKRLISKAKTPSMTSSKSERRRSGRPGSKLPSGTASPVQAASGSQQSSKFPPTPPAETITKKDYVSKSSRIPCPVNNAPDTNIPRQPPGRRRWSGSRIMTEMDDKTRSKQRSSMSNLTLSTAPTVSTF